LQDGASYTLADLLIDDSFRTWIKSNGQEGDQRWSAWMQKHPDKAHLVEEARQILMVFETDTYQFPEDRKENLRQKVITISQKPDSNRERIIFPAKQASALLTYWPQIAASILILLTLTGILYGWLQQNNDRVEYRTASGEIKQFQLPDGSKVTLNANSTLTFPVTWDARGSASRKVWLKGEAYFEVEKKYINNDASLRQKFMVFTDNLVVEVLGTKFNVNNQPNQTEVILNSGSVKLQMSEQEIMMEPGDFVAVSAQQKSVTKKVINPENYTAWRSGQLYFDGASVEEIKQTLEDNYGVEIIFEDWQKTEGVALRGIFPTNNLQLLLQALAHTTQTSISKKGNQIFYK
jgi:transmembrane sensor